MLASKFSMQIPRDSPATAITSDVILGSAIGSEDLEERVGSPN
jgi:hypothetical protein